MFHKNYYNFDQFLSRLNNLNGTCGLEAFDNAGCPQFYPQILWKTPADPMTAPYLRIALPTPLLRLFDYLPPTGPHPAPVRGQRVVVPFGKQTRVGVIVTTTETTDVPQAKLRQAIRILDSEPLLDSSIMNLLDWAADYYRFAPGEVIASALPGILRKGGSLDATEKIWRLTDAGRAVDRDTLHGRAPVQNKLLDILATHPAGATAETLSPAGKTWRQAAARLVARGWLETTEQLLTAQTVPTSGPATDRDQPPQLTGDQQVAVEAINRADGFTPFLLEGITGSGKTEVYLQIISRELERNRQTLLLVPEIGLTPQLVDRFRKRLDTDIAVLHSGLNDTERLSAWRDARSGRAGVVIGTRSAVFTPLPRPGLIIIDEEHDTSFKQQEGFRYSARDLAVWRARQLNVAIVLGSATPSFESLENANAGRYARLQLTHRPGKARQPTVKLIDLRRQPVKDGLTEPMRQAIARHLDADGQVLIYLNRRGFSPALLCTDCGALVECRRCDARLVYHKERERLICHHCGTEHTVPTSCAHCGSHELIPVGQGTERLEQALADQFGAEHIVRIDRDTTRRKGEIERRLDLVRSGTARLLLGTQMLTKGHDFPNVTMVGIIDADQGLFGTDFRSSERLAQSFVQVSGRAGRGERPGEVYIQTLFPEHPLLRTLVADGYEKFAEAALAERKLAGWPPYSSLALVRAEAPRRQTAFGFLADARDAADRLLASGEHAGVSYLGPASAPMERRAGRYRGQLLIRTANRAHLQQFLAAWRPALEQLKSARQTRWSLDIDPTELF